MHADDGAAGAALLDDRRPGLARCVGLCEERRPALVGCLRRWPALTKCLGLCEAHDELHGLRERGYAHRFDAPLASMSSVHLRAVYCVPRDVAPSDGWLPKQRGLLQACQTFHSSPRAFGRASSLRWTIEGPVLLAGSTSDYRAGRDDYGYFHALAADVREALGDDTAPGGGGEAEVLLLFADFGLSGPDTAPPIGVADPSALGGWGGCCAVTGCALVTEEVWKRPDGVGSAIVVYHEAVGHGNGMPHPEAEHPRGVMGRAQYCGRGLLSGAVYLEPELLKRMLRAEPPPTPPPHAPTAAGAEPGADASLGCWHSLAEPGTAWRAEGLTWVERHHGAVFARFAQVDPPEAEATGGADAAPVVELFDAGRSLYLRLFEESVSWSLDRSAWHSLGRAERRRPPPAAAAAAATASLVGLARGGCQCSACDEGG